MQAVISRFDDAEAAQRAARRLADAGFPADRLHLHQQGMPPRNAMGVKLDEYVTGGFITGVLSLLDELLDRPVEPDKAETYDDVVRREGVGLSVTVDDAEQAQRVEALLAECGAANIALHTGLGEPDAGLARQNGVGVRPDAKR
jgi:hypothetical protein